MFNPTMIEGCIVERDIADGAVIDAEGVALVTVMQNGVAKVKPSTGSADEKFVGFSYFEAFEPTIAVKVDSEVVGASQTKVTLSRVPISGQISCVKEVNGEKTEVAATSGFTVDGNIATLVSPTEGAIYHFMYSYKKTVEEISMTRVATVNNNACNLLRQIPVYIRGEFETDYLDNGSNWMLANEKSKIKLGANGRLTLTGSGTDLNVQIIQLPTASNPVLKARLV